MPPTPSLDPSWDLVVVGGGVIGLSAAWLATQDLAWRVLVIERDVVGGGATGRSLGVEVPFGRNPAHRDLTAESLALWSRLDSQIPGLERRPLDSFWLLADGDELDHSAFLAPAPRPATARELRRLNAALPGICTQGRRVLVGGRAYQAPPRRVARLLAQRVESLGGALWEGSEVVAVDHRHPCLEMRLRDGRRVAARRVLLAPGPWALSGPAAMLAEAQRVRLKKVVALHVDQPPPSAAPLVFLWPEDAFLLPDPKRRCWRFSFTSREWDCVPEISRLGIAEADRRAALEVLARYWPSAVEHCSGGQYFCDAYAPDWMPRVVGDPHCPAVAYAGAAAGSGFRLAPALARRALAILDVTPAPIDGSER